MFDEVIKHTKQCAKFLGHPVDSRTFKTLKCYCQFVKRD